MGVTRLTGNINSRGQSRSLIVPVQPLWLIHGLFAGDSVATAYLTDEVLSRSNLTIATSIMVEKVIFDQSGPTLRAIGVVVSVGPTSPRYHVAASREIILCAGVVGTPQILMLSGVGPADELAKHDIPLVHALPSVGRNFVDVSQAAFQSSQHLTPFSSMSRLGRFPSARGRGSPTITSLTRSPAC